MVRNFQTKIKTATALAVIGLLALSAAALSAKDKELPRPKLFDDLVACKSIADPTQRLACYDSKVTELDEAEKSNQLVMADRAEVEEARKGLFGLSLPRIRLFGDDDPAGASTLTAKITNVRSQRDGKYVFTLEDGATWLQTEASAYMRTPRAGDSITIEKGALGSYIAKVNDGKAFKIRRIVN